MFSVPTPKDDMWSSSWRCRLRSVLLLVLSEECVVLTKADSWRALSLEVSLSRTEKTFTCGTPLLVVAVDVAGGRILVNGGRDSVGFGCGGIVPLTLGRCFFIRYLFSGKKLATVFGFE